MSYASKLAAGTKAAALTTFKPSRADAKLFDDGLAFLQMTASFWAHIFYSEMNVKFTHDVPYMATDAHTVFVNPDGIREEKWGIEEVAFVIAHEICHYYFGDLIGAHAWNDAGEIFTGSSTLPYDAQTMNKAMDYRINAALIQSKLGKFPTIGLYDKTISAAGMEDCVAIYARLFKQGRPTDPDGGFDEHLEPSDEAKQTEAKVGAMRRAQVTAAAVQAQEAAGHGDELPAIIKRMIGDILNPKVKWDDHLKASMQRAQGVRQNDWAKVNKRMISRPVGGRIVYAGQSKYGCGTIVVGWDTSSSTDKWQNGFFSTMAEIVADLNPAELIVLRCDTKVHNVDRLDDPEDLLAYRDHVNEEGIGGGGGTRFAPVFDWLRDEHVEPDMCVYLTDLEGSFPDYVPDYPTIWACVKPDKKAPFGEIVEIEA